MLKDLKNDSMNWGKSIVIAFLFFVGFIATLVVVCFREDVSLVSQKYYEDDLHYQEQFEAEENTNALPVKPALKVEAESLELVYANLSQVKEGKITLMRPSDSALDETFVLKQQQDSVVRISVPRLTNGLYKVRFQWKEGNKAYRLDKAIVI